MTLFAVLLLQGLPDPASYGDRVEIRRNVAYGSDPHRRLDLYRPRGDGPFPVVVCWFGGGFTKGSRAGMARVAAFLAAEGFAAAAPEYFLANADEGRPGWPRNLHDAKAAVRFLRSRAAELKLDGRRMSGLGSSAGSWLAMMTAFTPDRPDLDEPGADGTSTALQAVVNIAGVVDRRGAFGTGTRHLLGLGFEGKPDLRALASPVLHLTAKSPPVYTLHGLKDEQVTPDSARALDARLRELGVDHCLHWVAEAGHQPMSAEALSSIACWLYGVLESGR